MGEIPKGFCQCGCGGETALAKVTYRKIGHVKGEPVRFIKGHTFRAMNKKGPDHYAWKGGRSVHSNGYIVVRGDDGKRVYEHIMKAENALGRKLRQISKGHPDNEVVHHINGDKTDNRNENLLICTHRYHTALHRRLENSPDWPEFPKIVRRGFGGER